MTRRHLFIFTVVDRLAIDSIPGRSPRARIETVREIEKHIIFDSSSCSRGDLRRGGRAKLQHARAERHWSGKPRRPSKSQTHDRRRLRRGISKNILSVSDNSTNVTQSRVSSR